MHSAKELLQVGVRLWAGISSAPEDVEAVREVYEDCGIIEVAEPSDDEDEDYEVE